ncbi:4-hydroxy-tetrahydrodipicolinate reductase [Steroidobacter denitrificans]|uniref:4-hydroxy-tetrahydrodipicolinate reductase n=1 Tax=Steroidobacter denitrificans TaxID=465721 RepID=A0A127F9H2_STEDE|nr:hypothetical protein [Steroidobacter denitrificans]AMN46240.1 4-hydroxy-tetrahydrodipicolinate reductase [Steroidobacter denitrificans]
MTYKVVQWATGGVGIEALRGILQHPGLELAGLLVHSEAKDGKDAGMLCDMPRVDVIATRDKEAIFALEADCVCYTPQQPNLDDVCRLLESGKNVVTTSFLFHPASMETDSLQRLEAACRQGNSSVHGTGINPGFIADELVLAMSGLCRRIDRVKVIEYADWSQYGLSAPEITFDLCRFGHAPQDARDHPYTRFMGDLFLQSVRMVAEGIGLRLDDTLTSLDFELAERDFKVGDRTVETGTVAGQRYRWQGVHDDKPVVEIETLWTIGHIKPKGWPTAPEGWSVIIEGDPPMRVTFNFDRSNARCSVIATAMHAVNSIVPLCQAEPGIRTFLDLPLIRGAHVGTQI